MRYRVQRTYELTGRGPAALGWLEDGEIPFSASTLQVEGTATVVRIRSREMHSSSTEDGELLGIFLHPEDADLVTAGTVLVGPTD
ncbi:hypothetical protein [Klenkia taihuensis]|uniref:hypothetical protein n=1 Tax=Klenkia taihuensis TaxID=1225127 RepID=UPI001042670C|nr:hypothetical protein [Klenkia taihuensis]